MTETQCETCARPIEAGSAFCRHCGARQNATARARSGLVRRLQDAFPRHHLQDDLMHAGQILAGAMAVIGLLLGVAFLPAVGLLFITFAIALQLQLLIRERTLDRVRGHEGAPRGPVRYHAARGPVSTPAEGAPARPADPPRF